ncbi:MAG: DUF3048 domain-containing protein [Candidatus Saccharimonadales bacterium]
MLMGENATHPLWIERFKAWVTHHPKKVLVIAGTLLLIVAATTVFALIQSKSEPEQAPATVAKATPKPAKPKYFAPLTGLPVTDEAAMTKPVTAVIIENSPDARPQSGLKQAEVVFEAIAEGGITRFMALYQQNRPDLVGPVRSIRSYHPDWLRPFDASIAHVGGSQRALSEIRNGTYRDIDQFFNSGSYWRTSDRAAPHNVYTSFERLDRLNTQKGYTSSAPKSFKRVDGKPSETPNASQVTVAISSAPYTSSYVYDKANNAYIRSIGGTLHTDREEGALASNVVIAIRVAEETVWEETWREQIQTTGEGIAIIFQNGIATEVTWRKPTPSDQFTFFNAEGKPVALVRGQTWITAVPDDRGNISWQ